MLLESEAESLALRMDETAQMVHASLTSRDELAVEQVGALQPLTLSFSDTNPYRIANPTTNTPNNCIAWCFWR